MSSLNSCTCANTPIFTLELTTTSRVLAVHDGDTISLAINVMNKFYRFNCRLIDIDTIELTGDSKSFAMQARNRLLQLCTGILPDKSVKTRTDVQNFLQQNPGIVNVKTYKWDKYGRLLVDISNKNYQKSFSQILLDENLAQKYDGKTKLKWADNETVSIDKQEQQ